MSGVSGTLARALVALVPVGALLAWSAVGFTRRRTAFSLLQLCGAACLVVVVLAHVSEGLGLFPAMAWGSPTSPGHYVDLAGAVIGLTLVPVGYAGARRGW